MSSSDLPESVAGNIANWTRTNAEYTDARAREAWASEEIDWGVFGIPETFFIGPDGIIAGRHIGPIDEATLARGIEAIRPAATR